MPRPKKCRRVCFMPTQDRFGPLNSNNHESMVKMTVDEYETIRLIDYEGLTQDQCAQQMKIARTTVQGIYFEARKKIAAALIEGLELKIEGGDYRLCEGLDNNYDNCYPKPCCRQRNKIRKDL